MGILRNKQAWIRIVEAFISIMIILGVLLVVYNQNNNSSREDDVVYSVQKAILEEIAFNDSLRNSVLTNDTEAIKQFAAKRVPPGFYFDIKICDTNEICNMDIFKENVYSSERLISATIESFQPRKIKIFMWLKE